jgi:type VI secretion system protein ImpF
MSGLKKTSRLSAPFMFAFRSAYEARDTGAKPPILNDEGEHIVASRKSAARAAVTEPILRKEVSRDLETLLNTIALESTLSLRGLENVRKSILNFGLPDLTHRSIDELTVGEIKDEIEAVIRHFEPRLIRETVSVSRDTSVDITALKIRFMVRADLLCRPLNVPVEFTADLDPESGKIVINRL